MLPCEDEPDPPYAKLGVPPVVRVWTQDGFVWDPPQCSGWGKGEYALLVALAGRFKHAGDVKSLVRKFARISHLKKVRYWSISTQRWRDLYRAAYALSSAKRGAKRRDFRSEELPPRRLRYFWLEEQGPIGAAVFRMRVLERTQDRLVIDFRNHRAVRPTQHPKLSAGGYRYLFIFEKEAPELWRFYSVTGLRGAGGSAISWIRGSYVNRAVALFRYVAGIPMEEEPPAAR